MSRNKLIEQQNLLENLTNAPPIASELNSSSIIKLFIIGTAIGAMLGAFISKVIFSGNISDAYATIISALISGFCTILGAIIQRNGSK